MLKSIFQLRVLDSEALDVYLNHVEQAAVVPKGTYGERHHLLPKGLFPEHAKDPWNIKRISPRDHFIAHYLLWKLLPNPTTARAWNLMSGGRVEDRGFDINFLKPFADDYSRAKEMIAQAMSLRLVSPETRKKLSEAHTGKVISTATKAKMSASRMGHSVSEGTRQKLSEATKRNSRPVRGPYSEEHKQNISKAKMGHEVSLETRQKLSVAHSGRVKGPTSEETRRRISEAKMGHHVSDEARKKMSESHKGKPSPSKGTKKGPRSEETKRKIAETMRLRRSQGEQPVISSMGH